MTTDYHGNSLKSKGIVQPEPKQIEKVVSSTVVQKKKPLGRKIKELFIAADFKSVLQYVGSNVLLPAARSMVVDASSRGIERLMYGEAAARRSATSTSRFSYQSPVQRPPDPRIVNRPGPSYVPSGSSRSNWNSYDYILATRADAEIVIETMADIISTYSRVTMADLHQMLDIPVTNVDHIWGWNYIGQARIVPVREGFMLDLPPVVEV